MIQDLPLAQIERVEIVRGPQSSLYGADAIGGVIQIFTRRNQGDFAPHLQLGGGSNGLREASGGIGGSSERGWFGADIAYQHSDGIDACRGSATLFTGATHVSAGPSSSTHSSRVRVAKRCAIAARISSRSVAYWRSRASRPTCGRKFFTPVGVAVVACSAGGVVVFVVRIMLGCSGPGRVRKRSTVPWDTTVRPTMRCWS
jgi:hypothetical protein